jgi:hypothetical protein
MHCSADDKAKDVDTWRTNTMGYKPNNDIRKAARDAGVGLWEIADAMRMSDIAMLLRRELTEWDRGCFLWGIQEIKKLRRTRTRIAVGTRWDIYS